MIYVSTVVTQCSSCSTVVTQCSSCSTVVRQCRSCSTVVSQCRSYKYCTVDTISSLYVCYQFIMRLDTIAIKDYTAISVEFAEKVAKQQIRSGKLLSG